MRTANGISVDIEQETAHITILFSPWGDNLVVSRQCSEIHKGAYFTMSLSMLGVACEGCRRLGALKSLLTKGARDYSFFSHRPTKNANLPQNLS